MRGGLTNCIQYNRSQFRRLAQIKKTHMYHLYKTHTDCLLETTYWFLINTFFFLNKVVHPCPHTILINVSLCQTGRQSCVRSLKEVCPSRALHKKFEREFCSWINISSVAVGVTFSLRVRSVSSSTGVFLRIEAHTDRHGRGATTCEWTWGGGWRGKGERSLCQC